MDALKPLLKTESFLYIYTKLELEAIDDYASICCSVNLKLHPTPEASIGLRSVKSTIGLAYANEQNRYVLFLADSCLNSQ